MNILIVHEVDWLRKVVYDPHMLAEAMSLRGHNVYVVDYESMWNGDESPNEFEVSRVFSQAKVHLIRSSFIKVAGLSRLSASFMQIRLIRRVIKEKKIDAIVLYSVPTNGLQTVYWAKRYGVPVIFRSLDVLNELVAYPVLRPLTKYLEKVVYSNVDMVLSITPKLSEYVKGLGTKRAEVLPMPVDTWVFRRFTSMKRNELGLLSEDKVILFMGTLFRFSGLASFIPKLKYIRKEVPKAKLLIVGDGSQRSELESIIKTADLQNHIKITGFKPYQDMPDFINAADICILPFENNNITRDIFPGKIVQFLSCGKPLVASKLPGIEAMLEDDKQGVVYGDSVSDIADKVISFLKHPREAERVGNNGWLYVRAVHDCFKVAKDLEKKIVELVNAKR